LKRQAEESNRLLLKSEREKKLWKAAAISIAIIFGAVETWRGVTK
jgi:hypothetical protein